MFKLHSIKREEAADGGGKEGLMGDESVEETTPEYNDEQIESLNLSDEQKAEYEKTGKFELSDEQQTIAAEFNKTPERPEYIDEKYWDTEKGEVKIEALAKSNADLFKKNAELLRNKGENKAPEKAEDYTYTIEVDGKEESAFKDDDPLYAAFREFAHTNGLPQEAFEDGLDMLLGIINDNMPEPIDKEAEKKALGPQADNIVKGVAGWIKGLNGQGILSKEEAEYAFNFAGTANGVKLLSKLRDLSGEKPLPLGGEPSQTYSDEELYAMMDDEYYSNPTRRKEVDELFAKRFGKEPASRSPANV